MKRHAALLLGLMLTFASLTANAGPKLVELAVFTCPHCKELQNHVGTLNRELGDDFIFAPIALQPQSSYAARAYYALRDNTDRKKLADALFAYLQDMRMTPKSDSDVLQWLKFKGFQFDADAAREDMSSAAVSSAAKRAIHLAALADVRAVPAMVLIDGGQVVWAQTIGNNQSKQDFVNTALIKWKKRNESD